MCKVAHNTIVHVKGALEATRTKRKQGADHPKKLLKCANAVYDRKSCQFK